MHLSLAEARRVALAAQGFTDPRPTGRVDIRHLRRVLRRTGVVQIDSVNVLVRSQELPLFARLGPHPRQLIPAATAAGELFEYWVHMASHAPVDHHHLFRWRMRRPHHWPEMRRLTDGRERLLDEVYEQGAERGPVAASELSRRTGPKGTWWDWDDGKVALEALFYEGRLSATRRPSDFARLYDLTERVIPADVLARPTPTERDARSELLVLAARHHGVGTLADLCDYHRMKPTDCRPLVAELVEAGRLLPVTVEGWDQPAYLHPSAIVPRSVPARALLSPFDPVVWCRARAAR
ncbi:MAG: winged helix-turn-helix domain-containing protein, partial [Ilumatobacteraceae bacterium]